MNRLQQKGWISNSCTDGLTVSKKWENGLATFHGMHSRGFPNFSFLDQLSPASQRLIRTHYRTKIHLAHILKTAKDKGAKRIEASQEAEEKWIQTIIEKARLTAEFQENCTGITTMREK